MLNGCGGRIRTNDLRVMSPTSYQTAPPRDNEMDTTLTLYECQANILFNLYFLPIEKHDSCLCQNFVSKYWPSNYDNVNVIQSLKKTQ